MLHKNYKVNIVNNKIICRQNKGTPGVYKNFICKLSTKYKVSLSNYLKGNAIATLWISQNNNKTISNNKIIDINNLYFNSGNHKSLKIGVLFRLPKINQFFFLKNILINIAPKDIVSTIVPSNSLISNSLISNQLNQSLISNLKISIVIPCHHSHFKHLHSLLKIYETQTKISDEIIIVLSESGKIRRREKNKIKKESYKFQLKFIEIKGMSRAGNNRYLGTKNATGEIIIFQDADDIPHRQRNEVISYFFEKYPDMVHICHQFSKTSLNNNININNIITIPVLKDIFSTRERRKIYEITNGNIAIRRKIYSNINWYKKKFRGQDVALNMSIFKKYKKTLLLKTSLYLYRKSLSAIKHSVIG